LSVGSLKWLAVRQNGWHALFVCSLPGTVIHPPNSCGARGRSGGGVRPGTRQPDSALDGETGHSR